MPLIDRIKYYRDNRGYDTRSLLNFTGGWLSEEAESRMRIYTSAEVAEIVNEILDYKNDETPAAGTAGESR